MSSEWQYSKIFIRNVTVLDCAIWDLNAGPLGRSWSVDVEWHGLTDAEGVVVDFSKAKKLAKDVIDFNFDHRLLVPRNHTRLDTKGQVICLPPLNTQQADRFMLHTYETSVSLLPFEIFEELTRGKLALLEDEIASRILEKSPRNVKKVKVSLSFHPQAKEEHFFNYLHSLRLHDGNCQRFHGHSNTIEVVSNGSFDPELSAQSAKKLDGKYLVSECYLKEPSAETLSELNPFLNDFEMDMSAYSWITYKGSQGTVSLRVPNARLQIMPAESTIENIVQWVYTDHFKSKPNIEVRAFEGLHKGAIFP